VLTEEDGMVSSTPTQDTKFDPARTALLVIDPVNDFLSEGGAAWPMTKSTVKKNDVVAQLRRLIDGARDADVPVIFGPMAYTQEDYTDAVLQRRSGINRLMFETKMFLAGSWGADFHPDVQPAPGDVILQPHKGTDVFETDLPVRLERLGTTHLVIAGMTANLCVESTGRHAAEHGYDVTFLSDAIGAESLPAYEASIHVNYPLIANAVLEVDEFLTSLRQPAGEADSVRVGDTVVGSDRGEIGRIEKLVPADARGPGYMVVPRGVVFEKDTYIPMDSVTKRIGDRVFINVPKLVVGKLPWNDAPTPETWTAKLGDRAGSVDRLYRSHEPTGDTPRRP
jgi:nicotinamidase-related amidase